MNKKEFVLKLKNIEEKLRKEKSELSDWSVRYLYTHGARYKSVIESVLKNTNDKSTPVLELGSAPYHITLLLHELGYAVKAVDLEPKRMSSFIKKHNLDVVKCDFEREQLPFKAGSFNLVLFTEVFEHLRVDPIFTLREINRVMSKDGVLILGTPNLYSFINLARFFSGKGVGRPYHEFEKLYSLGHMGHVREYSLYELNDFLSNTGFKIKSVKSEFYSVSSKKYGTLVSSIINIAGKFIPPFWKPFFMLEIVKS